MICEKELSVPAFRRRTVTREIALFSERSGALTARGLHFSADGSAVTVGEGAETEAKVSATDLMLSAGQGNALYLYGDGVLQAYGGGSYSFPEKPNAIVAFRNAGGREEDYAVTERGIFRLGSEAEKVSDLVGTCAAIHYERLFVARGMRLRWSDSLAPDDWTDGAQKAGSVTLPSDGGEIVALFSFRETLCLLRERGVGVLVARGDNRDFCYETVPASFGNVIKGSAALCGEEVVFLTDGGLYAFNGKRCVRRKDCGFSELDLSAPVSAAGFDGNYYAAVTRRGERCIWRVTSEEEGSFLRYFAKSVAGGDALRFLEEDRLCRLRGRGVPKNAQCTLFVEPSFLGLSAGRKFLDGVAIEGRGEFRIEARGARGSRGVVCGSAGENLLFPRPVRGTAFGLTLNTFSNDARVEKIKFALREEVSPW